MRQIYVVTNRSDDLYLSYYGHEVCPPGLLYGPAVRDHYLWVYVVRGRGIYRAFGQERTLGAGQSFLLFPNELTLYRADLDDPWEYQWVGFGGTKAGRVAGSIGVSSGRPVFTHARPGEIEAVFERLLAFEPSRNDSLDRLFYDAVLSSLLHEIGMDAAVHSNGEPPTGAAASSYMDDALNFMKQHYDKNIDVSTVADYVGLERSYFTKKFGHATGMSPYDYILELRLARAKEQLERTDAPIEHIALLLSFNSTFHFSSFFKRRTGMSPSVYRRMSREGGERGL